MIDIISKEQFLVEHNRLSPTHLQATFALLARFQKEKRPLLKDAYWSNKLRIPFIAWLISLPRSGVLVEAKTLATLPEKKKHIRKTKKQIYKNYPETK